MVERKTIESESNLNSTNKVQQLELHSDYIRNARYNIERRCSAGEAMMVFSDHEERETGMCDLWLDVASRLYPGSTPGYFEYFK